MLNSAELAKRLRAAMDNRNPPILSAHLAERCGVTRQAVNGWRKYGRFHKRHLQTIAEMTGQPLEFFLEGNRASSKTTKIAWQRIGAAMSVLMAILAFAPQQSEASFSQKCTYAVYYVKSLLLRFVAVFVRKRTSFDKLHAQR